MHRLKWLFRWHNIKIAPIVLLVRLPIMTLGLSMAAIGNAIAKAGNWLPGWREFP